MAKNCQSLQIREWPGLQRSISRAQRVGWSLSLVIIVSAASGLLGGGGPVSRQLDGPTNLPRVSRTGAEEWMVLPASADFRPFAHWFDVEGETALIGSSGEQLKRLHVRARQAGLADINAGWASSPVRIVILP